MFRGGWTKDQEGQNRVRGGARHRGEESQTNNRKWEIEKRKVCVRQGERERERHCLAKELIIMIER